MDHGIHNLQPAEGSTHRKKRLGRGIGSGHGKTSGKGHKGQKARRNVNPNFEGGQTPLHRRLPQTRGLRSRNPFGFNQIRDRSYNILNLDLLAANFEAGVEITPEKLIETGLLREIGYGLKILGNGDLTKALIVSAHAFSASAKEKLAAAGGTATVLPKIRYAEVK